MCKIFVDIFSGVSDRKPLNGLKTIQNRKVSIIPYCTIAIVVVKIEVEHRFLEPTVSRNFQ